MQYFITELDFKRIYLFLARSVLLLTLFAADHFGRTGCQLPGSSPSKAVATRANLKKFISAVSHASYITFWQQI